MQTERRAGLRRVHYTLWKWRRRHRRRDYCCERSMMFLYHLGSMNELLKQGFEWDHGVTKWAPYTLHKGSARCEAVWLSGQYASVRVPRGW